MKRIIMSGGLGNQMFQYAFYLSLKDKCIACKIDISLYNKVKMHNGFELQKVFGINEETDTYNMLHHLWIKYLRKYRPSTLVYSDKIYSVCKDVYFSKQKYLMGDWINVSYFEDIAPIIRKTYSFKNIRRDNKILAQEMQEQNSVSIHIRRGDYLKFPQYNVCGDSYYESAIKYIQEKIHNPFFYIFSNEPDWSNEFMNRFKANFRVIQNNQGVDSYQDMFLMTQCKHNIIANSTFSWWGAWLNNHQEKLVVTPRKWFTYTDYTPYCREWIFMG